MPFLGNLLGLRHLCSQRPHELPTSVHIVTDNVDSRWEVVRSLDAEKAEAEKFLQEHAKVLSLKEYAIREFHLVRHAVDALVSKHNLAVSRDFDAHMK